MFCTKCGSRNADDAQFCRNCGADLTRQTPFDTAVAAPDPLSRPTIPGPRLLAGRYELKLLLGRGGMGEVWMAHDHELKVDVAIKLLPSQLIHDIKAVGHLKDEAKIARSLTYPSIVRLYNYERDEENHYLVMEFIHGIDLATYLALKGPLPEEEIIRIGCEVANALSHAHAEGIIHRDIKPSNIMLYAPSVELEKIRDPGYVLPDLTGAQVKLTDFGIARQVRESMSRYSQDTSGTLVYMSPEQLRGKGIDHRSDLYALGVTLYELSSGDPPFHGEGLAYQIVNEAPERIPSVSSFLNTLIMSLLEKEKEKRQKDAGEVAEILSPEGKRKAEEQRQKEEQQRLDAQPPSPPPAPPPQPRKHSVLPFIIGALVILIVAGIAITKYNGSDKSVPQAKQEVPSPAPLSPPTAVKQEPASVVEKTQEDTKAKETKVNDLLKLARAALAKKDLTAARNHYSQANAILPDYKPLIAFIKDLEKAERKEEERQEAARRAEEKRVAEEKKVIEEKKLGLDFVLVKGSCFDMGNSSYNSDENPVHRVCLNDFSIGKYEVTQGQWKEIMGNNPA